MTTCCVTNSAATAGLDAPLEAASDPHLLLPVNRYQAAPHRSPVHPWQRRSGRTWTASNLRNSLCWCRTRTRSPVWRMDPGSDSRLRVPQRLQPPAPTWAAIYLCCKISTRWRSAKRRGGWTAGFNWIRNPPHRRALFRRRLRLDRHPLSKSAPARFASTKHSRTTPWLV